jgi:hypothetical protein
MVAMHTELASFTATHGNSMMCNGAVAGIITDRIHVIVLHDRLEDKRRRWVWSMLIFNLFIWLFVSVPKYYDIG